MKFSLVTMSLLACSAIAAPIESDDPAILARGNTGSSKVAEKRADELSEFAQLNHEWLKPVVSLLVEIIGDDSLKTIHNKQHIEAPEKRNLRRFRSMVEGVNPTSRRDHTRASTESVGGNQTLKKKSDSDELRDKAIAVLRHLLTIPPPRSPHGGAGGIGGPRLPNPPA